MTWLATRIGRYMALVGAVLVAAWGLVAYGRKTGADGAKIEARENDVDRARRIEDLADEARDRDDSLTPDERLRKHDGALRD